MLPALSSPVVADIPEAESAAARLRALIEKSPEDGRLWAAYGALLKRGRRWLAAAAAFGQAARFLSADSQCLRNQALCLVECGRLRRAREVMARALKAFPLDAACAAAFGFAELRKGSPEAAAILLDRAAQLEAGSSSVWCALGQAYAKTRRNAAAEAAFLRARAADPRNVEAYLQHSVMLRVSGDPEGAAALLRQCRAAIPEVGDLAAFCFEQGMVLLNRHRLDEALPWLKRALAADPEHVSAHLGMALLLFFSGRWDEAWAEYAWRHRLPGMPRPAPALPEWRGEDVRGKTLFVRAEQGAGDVIQFSRYLPALVERGARVLLGGVPSSLRPLLAGMAGVAFHERGIPVADWQIAMLDLPRVLGTAPERFPPYFPCLHPAGGLVPLPRRTGTTRRVGVVWAGNPEHPNDVNRSCGAERFVRLAAQAGVEFVSFQTGAAAAELDRLGGDSLIVSLGRKLPDFATTAACLREIDLVITVDTALAHLAGAMGLPVWLLLPHQPDWRWGIAGDRTPWYPDMRLFRQERPGDWDEVFARVATALAEWRELPDGRPACPAAEDIERTAAGEAYVRLQERLRLGALPPVQMRRALQELIRRHPSFAEGWADLGVLLRGAGLPESAVSCYRRALACGASSAGLCSNLGNALNDIGQAGEAAAWHRRALELEPESAGCLHGLSISQRLLGQTSECLVSLQAAARLDPAHGGVRWDLCNTLLAVGRYEEGWAGYRNRWRQPDAGAVPFDRPTWDGLPFAGKTLLVFAEQGFGDTILAVRFLPAVRRLGGRVVVCCQPELLRLIVRLSLADRVVAKGFPVGDYDLQVPMMDLPGMFTSSPRDICGDAYLACDAAARGAYDEIFAGASGKLKVGIVWSGSETFKGNRFRAAGLEDFLRLAGVPGVALYSLQKGSPQTELKRAGAASLVTDLSPLLTDFDATAAVVDHLDLVVMTDSAVAHLAGALGKPVWNLLGPRAYWLWELDPRRTPWYASMRLFRRGVEESWAATQETVAAELAALASRRSAAI